MNFNYSKSRKIILSTLVVSVILIITLVIIASDPIPYDLDDPKFITKEMSPFNVTYGEWITKWWQWNAIFPFDGHPRDSFSSEKCNLNQDGPVWFLPDKLTGKEERTCNIPAGKFVLIGINTGIGWDDSINQILSDSDIRDIAKEGQEGATVIVDINGTKSKIIMNNRVESPFFNLTVSENSGLINECDGCRVGTFKAISDGYFLFYGPLDPGEYELKYDYDTSKNPIEVLRQGASVTYHLFVR